MVLFNDILGLDAFGLLLETFSETVTYISECGGTFERTCIVDRNPPAALDAAGNVVTPLAVVRFHDDAETGVAADAVDIGFDKIELALKYGQPPRRRSVFQIQSTDGGVVALMVR